MVSFGPGWLGGGGLSAIVWVEGEVVGGGVELWRVLGTLQAAERRFVSGFRSGVEMGV